jgi:beta-glucosidase
VADEDLKGADGDVTERVGRLFLEAIRLDMEDPAGARDRAREALEDGVGGFIVFGGTVPDVARLTEDLREEAGRPLWFAADLERGAGQQFEGAATLPPPGGLAAHPGPEAAVRRAAEITAREAAEIGINWVLAPVLDLDAEAENPIVGTRSFGADPDVVARLGRIWIEACQEAGVAACGKHFPGHGRTVEDSHLAFPVVRASREELEADLRPFREAAGVAASMMTAHVGYPALDGEGPATLEPAVLGDLLRREMGFDGLVVSDALVMEGFGAGGGTATEGWRAVRALRAGCDLLLYPTDRTQSIRTVRQAAGQDPDLRRSIAEALRRTNAALERYPARTPTGGDGGDGAAREAAAAELALGCVRARGAGPEERLSRDRPVRLHVLSDDEGPSVAGRVGVFFREELADRGWDVTRVDGPDPEADGGMQSLVLLEATPRAWKGRASLSEGCVTAVREALAEGEAGYLVLLGHPRLLDQLERDGACAWSSEPVMERAAARWLDERMG